MRYETRGKQTLQKKIRLKRGQKPLIQCVIGIASSIGGIPALKLVLSKLPANLPAPIVIVQHLSPLYRSWLAELLQQCTTLIVKEAAEGDQLHNGCVYLAPPNYHVIINDGGVLGLSSANRIHFVRPSAEPLFKSMAQRYRHKAIGVILTGYGQDGSTGVQLIKFAGGQNIAQLEAATKDTRMPQTAIETGDIDFVLALEAIASKLIQLTEALAYSSKN